MNARLIQILQENSDVRISMQGGDRTVEYQRKLKANEDSAHVLGKAVDIYSTGNIKNIWEAFKRLNKKYNDLLLIYYPIQKLVHIEIGDAGRYIEVYQRLYRLTQKLFEILEKYKGDISQELLT